MTGVLPDKVSAEPEGSAWTLCRGCRELIYTRRFERGDSVCPDCGWHGRLTATQRLEHLLDPDSAVSLDAPATEHDHLDFVDSMPYPQQLDRARAATGLDEAVRCAAGTLDGHPVVVAAMDFRFMGGSLGAVVGERITVAAEASLSRRVPLVIVTASGGARMQEGALALMQMAKTSQALGQLDRAGVLTVSVITDPTYGGVAASYATLCDVVLAEPGARLGFAGPRVIEQTVRQRLPEGFQTAEFLRERGLIDGIHFRGALRGVLSRLLAVSAPGKQLPAPASGRAVITDPESVPHRDAWTAVQAARHLDRPTTLDYIGQLVDGFQELSGDRIGGGDCPAIVAGVGRFDGVPVAVLGHQKGHTVGQLVERSFGMPSPAGYRKSARVLRLAAKLGLPVITLVDTPGAAPGVEAEEGGQAVAIAENIRLMAALPVPVVSVVTGEGGSGGALALAVADRVLAYENAVYSVISPEGCAAILWKDPAAAPTAARALGIHSRALLDAGIVDGIVPEPPGGAHTDPTGTADRLRDALRASLAELLPLSPDERIRRRHSRFRDFGAPGRSR